jgi:hypothetical protein
MKVCRFFILLLMAVLCMACQNDEPGQYTQLTDENYALAESQIIFADYVNRAAKVTGTNGVGVLYHARTAADPNDKTVVRINFDTRYSFAVLDLTCDATIIMPQTNGRYQSVWFVTEEHYNPMAITAPGTYTITQKDMGSKYVLAIFRTQVNMQDEADMQAVTQLQDAITLTQANRGQYVVTNKWNMDDVLAMRKKYQYIAVEKNISTSEMFGKKGEVSLENHNCGVACGWGGFTPDQAVYLSYTNNQNKPCTLLLKDVPVADNAFWSITVYDSDGYPQGEYYNCNSSFATSNALGEVLIHFGGNDKTADNYLDIFPGWTFILRLYLPQEAYFNGTWQQPALVY